MTVAGYSIPSDTRIFLLARISRKKNTETEVVTTQGGYRLATSIDGTLTGRGGDIIIVDDPLKPADAFSNSKRERVNDQFRNTLVSRLDDKKNGAIIVAMQRLHVDDLCGRLLRESDDWTVLSLPAIAEDDQQIPIGEGRYYQRGPAKHFTPNASRSLFWTPCVPSSARILLPRNTSNDPFRRTGP